MANTLRLGSLTEWISRNAFAHVRTCDSKIVGMVKQGIRSVRPWKSARAEAVHVRYGRERVSRAVPAHLPGDRFHGLTKRIRSRRGMQRLEYDRIR